MTRTGAALLWIVIASATWAFTSPDLVLGLSANGQYPREMFEKYPFTFLPCTEQHTRDRAVMAALVKAFESQGWTILEMSDDFFRTVVCQGNYCHKADAFLLPSGVVEVWRTPGQVAQRGPEIRWLRIIADRYQQFACLPPASLGEALVGKGLPLPHWDQLPAKEAERAKGRGEFERWHEWRERPSPPKRVEPNLTGPGTPQPPAPGPPPASDAPARTYRSPLRCACGGTILAVVAGGSVKSAKCGSCGGLVQAQVDGDQVHFTLKVVGIPVESPEN